MMKEILKKLLLFFNVLHTTRVEPGETELDYVPKNEIYKKKGDLKQFNGEISGYKFVKTRKKQLKK